MHVRSWSRRQSSASAVSTISSRMATTRATGHFAVDADPDSWRQSFEVNFFGALHLAQAVVPEMRKRGGGSIVMVNSGAAVRPPMRMGAYSSSKAALANLTRTLALEVGQWQIRVNGVFLGATLGETLTAAADKASVASGLTPEQWLEQKSSEYALGACLRLTSVPAPSCSSVRIWPAPSPDSIWRSTEASGCRDLHPGLRDSCAKRSVNGLLD